MYLVYVVLGQYVIVLVSGLVVDGVIVAVHCFLPPVCIRVRTCCACVCSYSCCCFCILCARPGPIPAALGEMRQLTRLDLENNQLSGESAPIPFCPIRWWCSVGCAVICVSGLFS